MTGVGKAGNYRAFRDVFVDGVHRIVTSLSAYRANSLLTQNFRKRVEFATNKSVNVGQDLLKCFVKRSGLSFLFSHGKEAVAKLGVNAFLDFRP